jgi:hypothetical protein
MRKGTLIKENLFFVAQVFFVEFMLKKPSMVAPATLSHGG